MVNRNKGLSIEDLWVRVGERDIIKGVTLQIDEGSLSILLGPNGSGKTSLLMAIVGFPGYEVTKGKIIFKGREIQTLSIDERARLGIGMMFQHPPAIKGVKLSQMVDICMTDERDKSSLAGELNLQDHLDRDVNVGFSGGELKRSEMLQVLAQRPELALFDEPESGVDMENISLIGSAINHVLDRSNSASNKMGLIITHTGFILDYVKADRGCVMIDGTIKCVGDPQSIISTIRQSGYEECVECHLKTPRPQK